MPCTTGILPTPHKRQIALQAVRNKSFGWRAGVRDAAKSATSAVRDRRADCPVDLLAGLRIILQEEISSGSELWPGKMLAAGYDPLGVSLGRSSQVIDAASPVGPFDVLESTVGVGQHPSERAAWRYAPFVASSLAMPVASEAP